MLELHQRGRAAEAASRFDEAVALYAEALQVALGFGASGQLFRLQMDIALVHARLGRIDEFQAHTVEAERYLALPGGAPTDPIELHYWRGFYRLHARQDAAGSVYDLEQAYRLGAAGSSLAWELPAGRALAIAYARADRPADALEVGRRVHEVSLGTKDRRLEGQAAEVLAWVHVLAKRGEEGLPFARRAVELAEAESPETTLTLEDIIMSREALGECLALEPARWSECRAVHERTLALLERHAPGSGAHMRLLRNFAVLLAARGVTETALDLLRRARPYAVSSGDARWVADIDQQLRLVAHTLDQRAGVVSDDAALAASLERDLAEEERRGAPEGEAIGLALLNIASVQLSAGSSERALTAAQRARGIFARLRQPASLARAQTLEAWALVGLRRLEAAEDALRPALVASDADPGGRGWTALGVLSMLRFAQGRHEEAVVASSRQLDGVVAHAARTLPLSSPDERSRLVTEAERALQDWLDVTRGQTAGYSGVVSVRGLGTRWARSERRASPDERGRLEALASARRELAGLAYTETTTEAERARIEAGLPVAQRRCDELARQIAASGGGAWMWSSVLRVRDGIGEGEALVDLDLGPRVGTAWVLRPRSAPRRVELGPTRPILAAAQQLRATALAPEATLAQVLAAGRPLRDLVWGPLEAHLGDTTLVYLVLDSELADLPFAALPGRTPGTTLLDDLTLVHLGVPQDLVPAPELPIGAGILSLGGLDYAGRMEALPGTELEARRAVEWFTASYPREPRRLLTGRVTEAALRDAVAGRRVVHLATHGFVLDDAPAAVGGVALDPLLFSGLALTPGSGQAGDGVLTALELADLNLGGVEVLVLSACDSARGARRAPGEAILGLVHGARIAGARSVIASLWPVSDVATALLMERFYGLWLGVGGARPMAPARALRQAALELRALEITRPGPDGRPQRGRPFTAPAFWAAFVAYGGARPTGQ